MHPLSELSHAWNNLRSDWALSAYAQLVFICSTGITVYFMTILLMFLGIILSLNAKTREEAWKTITGYY